MDSEHDTWNMDPLLLEEAIKDRIDKTGRKPKAIVVVYLYGMPAKIDEILAIAQNMTFLLLKMRQKDLEVDIKGVYVAHLANMAYCRSMATR